MVSVELVGVTTKHTIIQLIQFVSVPVLAVILQCSMHNPIKTLIEANVRLNFLLRSGNLVFTLFLIMNTTEKLCLQWNDFRENITSSFKELRIDREFTDVTLACEDGQQI